MVVTFCRRTRVSLLKLTKIWFRSYKENMQSRFILKGSIPNNQHLGLHFFSLAVQAITLYGSQGDNLLRFFYYHTATS